MWKQSVQTVSQKVIYLGKLLLLFTIVFPGLALIPSEEIYDPTVNYRQYVPKSRRWNRLRALSERALKILILGLEPITNWISSHESTWHEYKTRLRTRRMLNYAHKISEKMAQCNSDDEVYSTSHTSARKSRRQWKTTSPMKLFAQNAVAMATNSEGEPIHVNVASFDTDSKRVGIDNRCSACISCDINDFEGLIAVLSECL